MTATPEAPVAPPKAKRAKGARADGDSPTILAYKMPVRKPGQSTVAIRIGTHAFPCVPELDGISLLEFAGALTGMGGEDDDDDEGDAGESLAAMTTLLSLLRIAIVNYDAFRAFVAKHSIGIEMLVEIIGDLIGAYMNRPTEQPSES